MTKLESRVRAIVDRERHYSALLYGLILQVKRDPEWGPRWQEARKGREDGTAILDLLRETPTYGGIVKRIESYVEELAKLQVAATTGMRSGTSLQRLRHLQELLIDEENRRQEIEREEPRIHISELRGNVWQGRSKMTTH
jgi:hypothetical protein